MALTVLNIFISATLIGISTWIAGKRTDIAGLLIAMPLTSMLALALTQTRFSDPQISVQYAKDIFVAIPVSLLFFLPFLFANKLSLSFWQCYVAGFILLSVGYFATVYFK